LLLIFQQGKLIINLIDDFHNIHTVYTPADFKLSIATHMTSNLLDILDIPAVHLPTNRQNIHTAPTVTIDGEEKVCRGGIVPMYIQEIMKNAMKNFHTSYMTTLPSKYQSLKPKDTRKQIKEFR